VNGGSGAAGAESSHDARAEPEDLPADVPGPPAAEAAHPRAISPHRAKARRERRHRRERRRRPR
jgi:hypothetical protein